MKKITLSLFLLLAAFFSVSAVNFAGGTGSESDPYQIETADQLNEVRNFLSSHFILKKDINLTAQGYPIWLPIGMDELGKSSVFSGSFDGDGHVISNVNILCEYAYAGLFAIVSGKIRNVGVTGSLQGGKSSATVSGYGLLAGYLGQAGAPGEIANCFAEGTVTVASTEGAAGAGVMLGCLTQGSRVTGCYSKGAVVAPELNWVGGLVGRMQQTTCNMYDCYSEASVTGGKNVGGIVGRLYSSPANPMNAMCLYATGRVMGRELVGGIAGDLYNISAAVLIAANSSVSATSSQAARVGNIVNAEPELEAIYGLSTTEVKVANVLQTIVSDDTGKDGATRTLAQLQDPEFYEEIGMDLEETWEMPAVAGLPILQWQKNMSSSLKKALSGVPFTVFMQGKMIHVQNIEAGSDIYVYNAGGQLIKQQKSQGESDVVLLTQPGVYLVKVAGANISGTTKVICK